MLGWSHVRLWSGGSVFLYGFLVCSLLLPLPFGLALSMNPICQKNKKDITFCNYAIGNNHDFIYHFLQSSYCHVELLLFWVTWSWKNSNNQNNHPVLLCSCQNWARIAVQKISYVLGSHFTTATYGTGCHQRIRPSCKFKLIYLKILQSSSQVWNIAVAISKFTDQTLQNSSTFPLHVTIIIMPSITTSALDIIWGCTGEGLRPNRH